MQLAARPPNPVLAVTLLATALLLLLFLAPWVELWRVAPCQYDYECVNGVCLGSKAQRLGRLKMGSCLFVTPNPFPK